MAVGQIREKVQPFLIQGDIENALNLLVAEIDGSKQRRDHDNALMLKAKWENLKQEQLRGTLSWQEYEIAVNKIIAGIQNIANEADGIKENQAEAGRSSLPGKQNKLWYVLIPGICILALALWYYTLNNNQVSEPLPSANPNLEEPAADERAQQVPESGAKKTPVHQNKDAGTVKTEAPAPDQPKEEIEKQASGTEPAGGEKTPVEMQTLTIVLNGDDSKLVIDDKLIPGSGIFSTKLSLGEHKFEIIEVSASQKCIQHHTIDKATTKLFLSCN